MSSEQNVRCDADDNRVAGTVSTKSLFAEKLKAELEKRGWSLRKTAEEVSRHLGDGAKFGPAHVWHYLQARTLPRQRYLVALSRALSIDVHELMPFAPPPRRTPVVGAQTAFTPSGGQMPRRPVREGKSAAPARSAGAAGAASRATQRGGGRDKDAGHLTLLAGRTGPRPTPESPLVLLLADDPGVLLSVEGSLRSYGYDVVRGVAPQEDLQQIRSRRVGVLVADLDSDPAERLALVRTARQADPMLPVIYTVHGMARLPAGEAVAGAPCLRAPYHPHQLLNLVRQVVRRTRDEGEPHAA